MATPAGPVPAPGRVLSTLNEDGSRRWLRPKPSSGAWWTRRRAVAYVLMLVFFAVPLVRVGGRPLFLLDLPRREFSLFGTTFYSTDTLLFMLIMIGTLVGIFLVTSLFGRVWCGWGCPQTVYMEFLFRPIERLLEGGARGSQEMDRRRGLPARRLLKNAVYLVLSLILAHVFLAYFVPVGELVRWMTRPPTEHWTSFFLVMGTTALVFFDFAYFREQTCLVACPYGRLQSVLLDRRSLIVGYDRRRGEPRHKGVKLRAAGSGDCVDCGLCVLTCPTGIDIRDGLQMECIHCTQCMDACDAVMAKVNRPLGLIRYGSRDDFEGRRTGWVRPRVLVYPAVLALIGGLFVWSLVTRADSGATLLRGAGEPFTLQRDGHVLNTIRVKVTNHGAAARRYSIALAGDPALSLVAPINPLPVPAGKTVTTTVFVAAPRAAFRDGEHPVAFELSDGERWKETLTYRLVGPEDGPGETREEEER